MLGEVWDALVVGQFVSRDTRLVSFSPQIFLVLCAGATVFESNPKKVEKRKREKNTDPGDIDGYLGPWGKFVDEKTVMKPSEVSFAWCFCLVKIGSGIIAGSSQDDQTCQVPLVSVSLAPVNLFHNNSRHKPEVTVIFTLLALRGCWFCRCHLSIAARVHFDVYDESCVSV